MNLDTLIAEQLAKLVEGGESFGVGAVDRVAKGDVKPTIDALQTTFLDKIGVPASATRVLGSAGKKDTSGDLDVGIEHNIELEQLQAAATKAGFQNKMNRGLSQVSIVFPQYTATGPNGKFVQIDLVKGELDYLQWSHSSTPENKGGVMLRAMIAGIIKVITNKAVNNMKGIFSRDLPAKYKKTDADYSRDLQAVMKEISAKSREPWTVDDSMQPAQFQWEKAKRSFTPEQCQQIAVYFKEFMANQKIPVPQWLGEAKGMAYDKVQPFYGNGKGAQKGHGNVGGARNRGSPGYPVPPEMTTKRGAEGFSDEGFQTQDEGKTKCCDKACACGACRAHGYPRTKTLHYPECDQVGLPEATDRLGNRATGVNTQAGAAIGMRGMGAPNYPGKPQGMDPGMGDNYLEEAELPSGQVPMEAMTEFDRVFGKVPGSETTKFYQNGSRLSFKFGPDVYYWFPKYYMWMKSPVQPVHEAIDPGDVQKGIVHLDDMKPEQFLAFLKKYQDEPLRLEISEKVDGSARVSFGKGPGHIWTQSKHGSRKAQSSQYPDIPVYKALKKSHEALESKTAEIMAQWPEEVAFFVAEVLYTRFPNSIEYGPNVLMIHGVHGRDGQTFDDATSKKLASQVIKAAGGQLSDGEEPWKFEYKRTINPKDVMVDTRTEYDTLGQLYKHLAQKPRDKNLKAEFQKIQKQVKEKLIKMLRSQKSAYGPEGGDVEGLVFRDLDSGAMVKLVDKDFFTALNGFLWHHRNMLGRGAKTDSGWKTGLMQGFKEVVAEQVLGDKSAASTMLVRNLVQAAEGVQGKTPEERANKTLAAYIKQNKLMSKSSFARDFQRSLMGAFKDLQNMKAEWEEFKSKPQSMEFAGKKRTFPPEHVERTEQAIQGCEASLKGIKAGMDVASKITDPMTQKVALMKLFMGRKFEKLVAELGGEQDAEAPVEEAVGRWARGLGAAALLGAGGMTASDRPFIQMEPMAVQGQAPTIKDYIEEASQETGVPAELIAAIMTVESNGNPKARSPKGALGLMQVLPTTAKAMGIDDPMDPRQNILAGSRYLKKLSKAFNGNLDWVIAAYNMGPTALHKSKHGHRPLETRNYLKKVHKLLGDKKPVLKTESVFGADDPDHSGVEFDPGEWDVTKKYADKLAKRGIKVGKYLGSGAYGNAYDIGNNRVLKVTEDPDEARTSMYMISRGQKFKHIAKYFDVFKFPDEHKATVFGIVLEKLKTIKDGSKEDRALGSAIYQARDMAGEAGWTDPQTSWDDLLKYIVQADPQNEDIIETIFDLMNKYQIGEMRQDVNESGIWFMDYHPGNIGQRADGTWVIFDLGSESQSPAGQGVNIPVLEGGPIDRMTGPTDLGGKKIGPDDPDATLESIVHEQITRLIEAQQGSIGVTIGRFQPFHAGHAAIIRQLAQKYSNVIVFVAGQKIDAKNPFDHDTRLKMMELSLPDVWSKVKVFPATIQGKGTGYVPSLVANAAASGMAAIPQDGAIDVLVGEDRVKDQEQQAAHNNQHKGEAGYYNGLINVSALPGVKNDDDAGRISGTRVREALAGDDQEAVRRMLDPHLAQSPEFSAIYQELKDQLAKSAVGPVKKPKGKVGEMVEAIINELGMGAAEGGPGATRGGGTSGWSRAILAKDMTGDEIYNQMMRSPSTRMLQMTNHGTPNDHLPGMDALDQKESHEQDASKPTDLGEMIVKTMRDMVEGGSKKKLSPKEKAARAQATKAKVDAKNRAAAEARREKSKEILADPSHPQHMKERDWYNGARKRMGWPDLPALREPVTSMIDAENKWIPWSPEALKVPWGGKGDEPTDGDDDDNTTKAIGNGEYRLIKQLGPSARKSNQKTHDLDVDKDIEHEYSQITVGAKNTLNIPAGAYEVKEIGPVKSAFAGAKGDILSAALRKKYTYIIDELEDFTASVEAAGAGDVSFLRKFLGTGEGGPAGHSLWVGGHIATGNVNALKAAIENAAGHYKDPNDPLHKYAKENLGQNKRTIPYYSDPGLVMQDYLNVGKASDIFKGLQGVIIVKKEGFAVIPAQNVDQYIEVSSISKGQMKIRLTRQLPKAKTGSPQSQEPLTTPEPTPFTSKAPGA